MKRPHLKLLKSLIAIIVCLFVSIQPIYIYSQTAVIKSLSISVSAKIEPNQSLPYQYTKVDKKSGYLWKPDADAGWMPSAGDEDAPGNYWIPIGMWGSLTGKDSGNIQSEISSLGKAANSLAVEISWSDFDKPKSYGYGAKAWNKYDAMLSKLKTIGKSAFIVIDLNSAPEWFEDSDWIEKHGDCYSYYAPGPEIDPETGDIIKMHTQPWKSSRISYTNPEAIEQAHKFVKELVSRYAVGGARQNLAPAVAGWIIDTGKGFVDREKRAYIGYEDSSVNAFRDWLESNGDYLDITELNNKWHMPEGKEYNDFSEVQMPAPFDENGSFIARDDPGWYDLLKWRKSVIAGWIAGIAGAIKDAEENWTDPDNNGTKRTHLISALSSGSEPGNSDWAYSSIDMKKIAENCKGVLDFWSITCSPSFTAGNEGVSSQWELVRARAVTGLPVLVLQLKYKKQEDISEQQKKILQTNIWELLFGGAVGIHLFDGEDKIEADSMSMKILSSINSNAVSLQGMKITDEENNPVLTTDITGYLANSNPPSPDVGFLETSAQDSIFNRAEAETYSLYGPLKRLGFQPGFIAIDENGYVPFDSLCAGYQALILAGNQKMEQDILDSLAGISNIKLFADAGLPGIMDEYGNSRIGDQDWQSAMDLLFGVDVSNVDFSSGFYESPADAVPPEFKSKGVYTNPDVVQNYAYNGIIDMWMYLDKDISADGHILAYFSNDGEEDTPALIMNNDYNGCISLFSLGDSANGAQGWGQWGWQERYKWLELIFKNNDTGFDLIPKIDVSGSQYVWVDYREGPENSVLIYLYNYNSSGSESIELSSDDMLKYKKVESMLTGSIISEYNTDGRIKIDNIPPQGQEILLVTLTSPPNQPPSASFTASVSTAYTGEEIQFDASGSSDSDGSIVSYKWGFGDGGIGSGNIVTHKYTATGNYTVKLTVTDNDGSNSYTQKTVTVLKQDQQQGQEGQEGIEGTKQNPGSNLPSGTLPNTGPDSGQPSGMPFSHIGTGVKTSTADIHTNTGSEIRPASYSLAISMPNNQKTTGSVRNKKPVSAPQSGNSGAKEYIQTILGRNVNSGNAGNRQAGADNNPPAEVSSLFEYNTKNTAASRQVNFEPVQALRPVYSKRKTFVQRKEKVKMPAIPFINAPDTNSVNTAPVRENLFLKFILSSVQRFVDFIENLKL